MRLIGDGNAVGNGIAYCKTISISDAQTMTDLLCEVLHIKQLKVQKGREAINKHGHINFVKGFMRLNKPSEGIVLHELAHIVGHYHNANFKTKQKELYRIWFRKENL